MLHLLSTVIMGSRRNVKSLVYNPSSLRELSVCCVRQSISCMSQNVKNNFIKKLSSGELQDLKDPNVPVSLADMCKYDLRKVNSGHASRWNPSYFLPRLLGQLVITNYRNFRN